MIYDIFPQNSYCGNGQSTNFDFDFYIEIPAQLNVYHYNSDGAKTKLTYNVDYSIAELKKQDGSYITFPIAGSNYSILSDNERIVLELTLPISQEIEYNNSSSLNADTLEYSFDYLTRLVQILSKRIDYCIETGDHTYQDVSALVQNIIDCASKSEQAYNDIVEYGMNPATTTEKGVVIIGEGIDVDANGTISVNGLPSQNNQSGKFLTTNGSSASWTDSISTDLNGKADVDLTNINPASSAINEIIKWSVVDFSSAVALPKTVGTVQQADDDIVLQGGIAGGAFTVVACDSSGTRIAQLINLYSSSSAYANWAFSPIIPKNSYFKITILSSTTSEFNKFYLKKGS